MNSSIRHFMRTSLLGLLTALLSLLTLHAAPPPELTVLRQQYDKVVAERVTAPFDAGLAELNTKYTAGLDRAIADAKAAGKLEDILAIEAEKKRLADKLPIPATDDEAEPEALKKYRAIYRQQFATITAARDKTHADLLPPYTAKLKDLEAVLVKNDRVDEAKEVLVYRQGLAQSGPLSPLSGALPSPGTTNPPNTAAGGPVALPAAKEAPKVKGDDRKAAEWVLSLGEKHKLMLEGDRQIKKPEDLPKGGFSIKTIEIDGRYLNGNPVTATSLQVLAGLSGLEVLKITHIRELKDADLPFLAALPLLKSLVLSNLGVSDAVIPHLAGMRKLETLELGELALTGSTFDQLDKTKISKLVLFKCSLNDAGVAKIATLSTVEYLQISSHPEVTDACIPHLRSMPALKSLLIAATGITPTGFGGEPMPKITTLAANSIAKLPLSEIAPAMASIFPNVVRFDISYFVNTPEDLAALAHFKNLTTVNNFGSIKDEAFPGLMELRSLSTYTVVSNGISDAALETFAKLKKLKSLRYGNKPPNEAALAAFKKQRPDVKVEP